MTLDEFLSRTERRCAYVDEPGFRALYVRYAPSRWLVDTEGGQVRLAHVLTLANLEATQPGHGALTRLLDRLTREYPTLTVVAELAHARVAAFLRRHGFYDTLAYPLEAATLVRYPTEQQ